jgi:hypothetical protein
LRLDFSHPTLDQAQLAQSQIETETVKGLIGWQVDYQVFQALDAGQDFCVLCLVNASSLIGVVMSGEVQPSQEFEPDGARIMASLVQPVLEATFSGGRDVQDLPRRQFVLLDKLAGNVAARFQSFEDSVGLALAEPPDATKLGLEFLMQVVTVTWRGDEKSQQGEFRRYVAHNILTE